MSQSIDGKCSRRGTACGTIAFLLVYRGTEAWQCETNPMSVACLLLLHMPLPCMYVLLSFLQRPQVPSMSTVFLLFLYIFRRERKIEHTSKSSTSTMPSPKSLLKLPHFSSPKTLRLIDYYKGLSDKNKGRNIVWADISWNEFTAHYLAAHEALGQSKASLSYRRAQDEVRDSFSPPFSHCPSSSSFAKPAKRRKPFPSPGHPPPFYPFKSPSKRRRQQPQQ